MKIIHPIVVLLTIVCSLYIKNTYGQVFTESMGTVSGTTSINTHETANNFDNDGFTMSGTGDLRSSSPSGTYAGASGGANVFFTNTNGTFFQIAGISTTGCTSLNLTFGVLKSTNNFSGLVLSYSTNGTTFTAIPYTTTATTNNTWILATATLPAGFLNQASIILRWTNTTTNTQYRMDDVTLSGTCTVTSNTVTTGAVTGAPFTVNCGAGSTGTVAFTSTGTFTAGNIYTAELSNASGSFASPVTVGTLTSTANSGTINITIPAGTATGTGYKIRILSSAPAVTGSESTAFSVTNTPCSITPTVSGAPFDVTCSTGDDGQVSFTSVGTYAAGNVYTVELSSSTGSFATPVSVGTLASSANSGTINITIPGGTPSGTGYKIRIVSSNPAVTGAESTAFQVTLTGSCGPCYTGHAPNFTTSGYTIAGDTDSGGSPTNTIRLASGGSGGSVSTTATGVTAGSVTVRFRAKQYNATETSVTVTLGGQSQTITNLPATFDWVTVTFNGVPANPTLSFSTTTNRRVHIGNVELLCFMLDEEIIVVNVTGGPFVVDCETGDDGAVDFMTDGDFDPANDFTVQLSNASGSFATPVNIGSITLGGAAPFGSIPISIPASTVSGTNYRVRIISSNPSVISDTSAVFSITLNNGPCVLTPPHMTSVYINSCNGTCLEGHNELVFGTSGSYDFTVNTTNFDFYYGSSNPGTNYTDVLVNNSSKINQLNTAAGCPGLFIDATGTTIPANASWMLAPTQVCTEALQWSGLCGSGPIYVIFQNDPDWNLNGTFVNSSSGTRYFRTVVRTTSGNTFTVNYTINSALYPSYGDPEGDGVYATFDSDGGPAISYGDDDCQLTPVVLGTELISFNGEYNETVSILNWKTNSEINNSHYTISRSVDGMNWEIIGRVNGAGTTTHATSYELIDYTPKSGIDYYRLQSTDYDGKTHFKGIVAVEVNRFTTYYNTVTATIELTEAADVEIYSTDGKLIAQANNTTSIPFHHTGVFIIHLTNKGKSERILVR